jgi:hypothetical protein
MSRTARRIGRENAIRADRQRRAQIALLEERNAGLWAIVAPLLERRADVSYGKTGVTRNGTARPVDTRLSYDNATASPLRNVHLGNTDAVSLLASALPMPD